MKKYIFITYNVDSVGGTQLYTANKARHLINLGWEVLVFHDSRIAHKEIDPLKGIAINIPELNVPPYYFGKRRINSVVNGICKLVGYNDEEIIIESHADKFPLWGEMAAEKLGAKHICLLLNEKFNGKEKCYSKMIDFFYYKFCRGELMARYQSVALLFDGFYNVNEKDCRTIWINEDPVADVNNDRVNSLERFDYNICYIGRIVKGYVPNILDGVKKFALNHPHNSVQIVFVGCINDRRTDVIQAFDGINNIIITELGDLVPIPKDLFKRIDVVIAGSGSARCAANLHFPTIVADSDNYQSNGLLGYETQESVRAEKNQTTFEVALERTLIQRVYKNMDFKFSEKSVEECCIQNFEQIKKSDPTKEYFSKDKLLETKGIISLKTKLAVNILYWKPIINRM